jgi:hypothetical protein
VSCKPPAGLQDQLVVFKTNSITLYSTHTKRPLPLSAPVLHSVTGVASSEWQLPNFSAQENLSCQCLPLLPVAARGRRWFQRRGSWVWGLWVHPSDTMALCIDGVPLPKRTLLTCEQGRGLMHKSPLTAASLEFFSAAAPLPAHHAHALDTERLSTARGLLCNLSSSIASAAMAQEQAQWALKGVRAAVAAVAHCRPAPRGCLPALALYTGQGGGEGVLGLLEEGLRLGCTPLVATLGAAEVATAPRALHLLLRRLLSADARERARLVLAASRGAGAAEAQEGDHGGGSGSVEKALRDAFFGQLCALHCSASARRAAGGAGSLALASLQAWYTTRQQQLMGAATGPPPSCRPAPPICILLADAEAASSSLLGDLVQLLGSVARSGSGAGAREPGPALPVHLILLSAASQELTLRNLPPSALSCLRLEHISLPPPASIARSALRGLCVRGDLPLVFPASLLDLLAAHGEGYAAHPWAIPKALCSALGLHFFAPPAHLLLTGGAIAAAEEKNALVNMEKRHNRDARGTWFTQKGREGEEAEGGAKRAATAAAAAAAGRGGAASSAAQAGGDTMAPEILSDRDLPLPRSPWIRSDASSSGGGPSLNSARLSLFCVPLERWAVGLLQEGSLGCELRGPAIPCLLACPLWALCTRFAAWLPRSEVGFVRALESFSRADGRARLLACESLLRRDGAGAGSSSSSSSSSSSGRTDARADAAAAASVVLPDNASKNWEGLKSQRQRQEALCLRATGLSLKDVPLLHTVEKDGNFAPLVALDTAFLGEERREIATALFLLTKHRVTFATAATCVFAAFKRSMPKKLAQAPPSTQPFSDLFLEAKLTDLERVYRHFILRGSAAAAAAAAGGSGEDGKAGTDPIQDPYFGPRGMDFEQLKLFLRGAVATLSRGVVFPATTLAFSPSSPLQSALGGGEPLWSRGAAEKRKREEEVVAEDVEEELEQEEEGEEEEGRGGAWGGGTGHGKKRGRGMSRPAAVGARRASRRQQGEGGAGAEQQQLLELESCAWKKRGQLHPPPAKAATAPALGEEEAAAPSSPTSSSHAPPGSRRALNVQWTAALPPSLVFAPHIESALALLEHWEERGPFPEAFLGKLGAAGGAHGLSAAPSGAAGSTSGSRQLTAAVASATSGANHAEHSALQSARQGLGLWVKALAEDCLRPFSTLPLHECQWAGANVVESLHTILSSSPRSHAAALAWPWGRKPLEPFLPRPGGVLGPRFRGPERPGEVDAYLETHGCTLPDLCTAFRLMEGVKGKFVHGGDWWERFREAAGRKRAGGGEAAAGGAPAQRVAHKGGAGGAGGSAAKEDDFSFPDAAGPGGPTAPMRPAAATAAFASEFQFEEVASPTLKGEEGAGAQGEWLAQQRPRDVGDGEAGGQPDASARLERLSTEERDLLGRFWRAVHTLQEYGFLQRDNKGESFEKRFFTLVEYRE